MNHSIYENFDQLVHELSTLPQSQLRPEHLAVPVIFAPSSRIVPVEEAVAEVEAFRRDSVFFPLLSKGAPIGASGTHTEALSAAQLIDEYWALLIDEAYAEGCFDFPDPLPPVESQPEPQKKHVRFAVDDPAPGPSATQPGSQSVKLLARARPRTSRMQKREGKKPREIRPASPGLAELDGLIAAARSPEEERAWKEEKRKQKNRASADRSRTQFKMHTAELEEYQKEASQRLKAQDAQIAEQQAQISQLSQEYSRAVEEVKRVMEENKRLRELLDQESRR